MPHRPRPPIPLRLRKCPDYLEFIKSKIDEHRDHLYSVQITEEPDFSDGPDVIDGAYPNVLNALTEGAVAAKNALRNLGLPHVKVGFNATPTFGSSANFWSNLASTATKHFSQSIDYVGLDFFPDVFRPLRSQPGDVPSSVIYVLETMRNVWLPAANISSEIPIHITEHGWPTGPDRSPARQSKVLKDVIRTIHANRHRLSIERYTLFSLRDVAHPTAENSQNAFCFFGITDAAYIRKPAFDAYRTLISELGAKSPSA